MNDHVGVGCRTPSTVQFDWPSSRVVATGVVVLSHAVDTGPEPDVVQTIADTRYLSSPQTFAVYSWLPTGRVHGFLDA